MPSLISNIVLTHAVAASTTAACDGDVASLSLALSSSIFPSVVANILKRLWNDGPHALLFFRALLLLPSYSPSPSTFDLTIDIAARLRHPRSLQFFLSLRLPLYIRTFSILTECFAAAGSTSATSASSSLSTNMTSARTFIPSTPSSTSSTSPAASARPPRSYDSSEPDSASMSSPTTSSPMIGAASNAPQPLSMF